MTSTFEIFISAGFPKYQKFDIAGLYVRLLFFSSFSFGYRIAAPVSSSAKGSYIQFKMKCVELLSSRYHLLLVASPLGRYIICISVLELMRKLGRHSVAFCDLFRTVVSDFIYS